jgi:serine protease inhibitor
MASFGAWEAASMYGDTLDVKLNQPFIYIIRDANDTPIFVGHVDNPKA